MNLGAVENRARLVMAIFVLALILTIGLSLSLYSQSRRELAAERTRQMTLEAAYLATRIVNGYRPDGAGALRELLGQGSIIAAIAIYRADGTLMSQASTLDHSVDTASLFPPSRDPVPAERSGPGGVPDLGQVETRVESGFEIAEAPLYGDGVLVLARPGDRKTSTFVLYLFSYQVVALVFGLGMLFLIVRWLLRPYRRMVEAARGSPVHVSNARSESEFVVETFQALIEQLHSKERELANLHALEKRRAERSERFSERLIANIPSGLITIDARGMITSANAHARKIFNPAESRASHTVGGAIDREVESLALDYRSFFACAPGMLDMISTCLASGTPFRREEADITLADGRVRHLGLSISPITDGSNHMEGALCLITDITEVIELRERMKLQEGFANLGEMAAGLAHEFKNSLATIHGYIQLAELQSESANSESERRIMLDHTLNEVQLLTRLVTDFLNFARPQRLTMSEVSLRSIVDDCINELRPLLKESGIEVTSGGSLAEIPGDETLLRRAFANLVRNAAEAIDPLSGRKRIEITGSVEGGPSGRYAHIRITDTGGGISKSDLHSIFIPFFTTKSRGYGIGLAIVQKIFIAHGGDVTVERSDATGTTFHCRLPLFASPIVENSSQVVD